LIGLGKLTYVVTRSGSDRKTSLAELQYSSEVTEDGETAIDSEPTNNRLISAILKQCKETLISYMYMYLID
jgi:hypothetical protein